MLTEHLSTIGAPESHLLPHHIKQAQDFASVTGLALWSTEQTNGRQHALVTILTVRWFKKMSPHPPLDSWSQNATKTWRRQADWAQGVSSPRFFANFLSWRSYAPKGTWLPPPPSMVHSCEPSREIQTGSGTVRDEPKFGTLTWLWAPNHEFNYFNLSELLLWGLLIVKVRMK